MVNAIKEKDCICVIYPKNQSGPNIAKHLFFQEKSHPETEKISSFNMSKFECAYYSIYEMVFFVLIPYESYSTIKHIFKLVYCIYLFILSINYWLVSKFPQVYYLSASLI